MVEYEKDGINQQYVIDYIRGELKKNDGFLAELEDFAEKNNVPIVQPETAKLLEVLFMLQKPKRILEIGCAIGYSAILMAKASPEATITTLEFDEEMVKLANENIKKCGLDSRINVVYTDARDYISFLEGEEEYDCIFLDGPKAHYVYMLDDCIRLLKPNGLLICDNVLYKGMTASDDLVIRRKITIVKRLRSFIESVTSSDELETSLLPVGDGVTLSIKKDIERKCIFEYE